jgi:hypothetical protein
MKYRLLKIVVFVPKTHADLVRKTMGEVGAGIIGKYEYCTFSSEVSEDIYPAKAQNRLLEKSVNLKK